MKRSVVLLAFSAVVLSSVASAATVCSGTEDCDGGLACIEGVCIACKSSSECDGFTQCKESSGRCIRKELLNVSVSDVIGTLLIMVGAALAAGGGLGGGGIFVPLLILVFGMQPKQAVPISQVIIFGGSIVNMIFNSRTSHPTIEGRPLIDYIAILLFTPSLLAGATIGVVLNQVFPSWLITLCLMVTLVYASVRTGKKAVRAWKLETALREELEKGPEAIELAPAPKPESNLVHVAPKPDDKGDAKEAEANANDNAELKELLQLDNAVRKPVMIAGVITIFALIVSMFRGGKAGATSVIGIEACSWQFWLISVFYLVALLAANFMLSVWISRRTERKLELGWQKQENEILWSRKNAFTYPLFSVVAGILGGLLGIGGGMIIGPLLIELKVESHSAAATSATAVFLTALSASIQFLVLNLLIVDYAIWLFVIGLSATFIGQTLVLYLIRKTGRKSVIIACIAGVIMCATVMMSVAGILNVVDDIGAGRSLGFEAPC